MVDTPLFSAGSLFQNDYLTHGITDTADPASVHLVALAGRLTAIVDAFPAATQPDAMQTGDDLI